MLKNKMRFDYSAIENSNCPPIFWKNIQPVKQKFIIFFNILF